MTRNLRIALLIAAAALGLFLFLPTGVAISQEVQQVVVRNFPNVQKIEGDVRIKDPVRFAKLEEVHEVAVPPVNPKDTARLISGGTIVTDGFGSVVLSLSGQTKGEVFRPGSVGAILIPDAEPMSRAFDEKGQVQFPMEVYAAGVSGASAYFASTQPKYPVAFSRYKVWFYNTSDKTVTVNLYAYLTI